MNDQRTLGNKLKALLEELVKSLNQGDRQKAGEIYTQLIGEFDKLE